MKKFSMLALVLALSSTAFAAPKQSSVARSLSNRPSIAKSRLMLGAHFGPNFSTASWSASSFTPPDSSGRTRMMFGLFTEVNFLDYFAFQPELNYVQRGAELVDSPARGQTTTFGFNYLEVPLLVKAKYEVVDGVRPFFATGPSIGFLLGKGASVSQTDGRERETPDAQIRNNYSSVNMAWNFGLGTDIDVAKQWALMFDARYALGMSNILSTSGQRTPNGETDRNSSVKLSGFQVMIGLKTSML